MLIFQQKLEYGRFESWSSKPPFEVTHSHQVHGVVITNPETLPCEADGLFSSWEKLLKPLAIKTADCMPIVFEGKDGVVFLHAGWKGLNLGILEAAEIQIIKPVKAYIGPCIHSCCFEVKEDFKSHFPQSQNFIYQEGKIHFDLVKEANEHIKKSFFGLEIETSPICTMCDERFHSYRRNKTLERNWNLYIKG